MDCHTPDKRAYPTRAKADAAMRHIWRRGRQQHMPIRSYLCGCGKWHTTSKPYRKRAA